MITFQMSTPKFPTAIFDAYNDILVQLYKLHGMLMTSKYSCDPSVTFDHTDDVIEAMRILLRHRLADPEHLMYDSIKLVRDNGIETLHICHQDIRRYR